MVFLGAKGKLTRFAEVQRVLAWLERARAGVGLPTVAVPSTSPSKLPPAGSSAVAPHAEP